MIRKETYEEALLETVRRGATEISPDVQRAFENAIAAETRPAAREGLARTYDSLLLSKKLRKPACPDTGWPVFYLCRSKNKPPALQGEGRSLDQSKIPC